MQLTFLGQPADGATKPPIPGDWTLNDHDEPDSQIAKAKVDSGWFEVAKDSGEAGSAPVAKPAAPPAPPSA